MLARGVWYLIYPFTDSHGEQQRLISLIGISLILLTSYLSSKHHSNVKWRLVICGLITNYSLCITSRQWPLLGTIIFCAKSKFDQLDYLALQVGSNLFGHATTNQTLFNQVGNSYDIWTFVPYDIFGIYTIKLLLWNGIFYVLDVAGIIFWIFDNYGWFCKVITYQIAIYT